MIRASLPFFPFYPSNWRNDFNVIALSRAQRGLYMDLLCLMWMSGTCSIPNDPAALSEATGWRGGDDTDMRAVLKLMTAHPEDKKLLTNNRLYEEWIKAIKKHDKHVGAGIKGANVRYGLYETRDDTIIEESQPAPSLPAKAAPPARDIAEEVRLAWNEVAVVKGYVRCTKMTAKLKRMVAKGVTETESDEAVESPEDAYLSKFIAAYSGFDSTFHKGGGEDGWKADLEWALRPGKLDKIHDAVESGRGAGKPKPQDVYVGPKATLNRYPSSAPRPTRRVLLQPDAERGWRAVLGALNGSVTQVDVETWLKPCRAICWEGWEMVILANGPTCRDWANEAYAPLLARAAESLKLPKANFAFYDDNDIAIDERTTRGEDKLPNATLIFEKLPKMENIKPIGMDDDFYYLAAPSRKGARDAHELHADNIENSLRKLEYSQKVIFLCEREGTK